MLSLTWRLLLRSPRLIITRRQESTSVYLMKSWSMPRACHKSACGICWLPCSAMLSRIKYSRKPTSWSKCSLIRSPPLLKVGGVLVLFSLVIQGTLVVVRVSQFSDVVRLILISVFFLLCVIFMAWEAVLPFRRQRLLICRISVPYSVVKPPLIGP